MHELEFARVDLSSSDCPQSLKGKWHGKLVGISGGEAWSLEGPQDEGVGLSCDRKYLLDVTDEEQAIGELLEATFWDRKEYTEDITTLREIRSRCRKVS